MAWSSDLVRTKNWSTETLTDSDLEGQLDLIINWVMAAMNATTGHDHSGSANKGPKIPINSSLTIASQAQGDVLYASSSTAWARLGKGTASQVLTMNAGATAPEWATPASAPTAASKAEQEAGTEEAKYVAPATAQNHPSAAKFWVAFASNGTIGASYNVSSVTDNGTGDWTVNFTTPFSSTNYCVLATVEVSDAGHTVSRSMMVRTGGRAVGSVRVYAGDASGLYDGSTMFVCGFGDQ